MKNLSVIPKTVKLLKENTGEKLLDICLGNGFLIMTTKAETRTTKIEKWERIKWKIFRTAKEIKSQPIAFNSFWKDDSHVKCSHHRNKKTNQTQRGRRKLLEVMDMFINWMGGFFHNSYIKSPQCTLSLFVYFYLVVLGLRGGVQALGCDAWLFSGWSCRLLLLQSMGSRACALRSCGMWAL